MELLWLSSEELSKLLSVKAVNRVVEECLRLQGEGEAILPEEAKLSWDGDAFYITKIGGLKGWGVAGVKWLATYRSNPDKGLPVNYSTLILNDGDTGRPLAVMEGGFISEIRTGSVSAIGARYLAKRNPKTLGIIGTGRQGRWHLRAMASLFDLEEVRVFDKDIFAMKRFISEAQDYVEGSVLAEEPERVVRGSDVVVISTTAGEPVLEAEWMEEGTCLIGITGFRDLPEELLYLVDRYFVDDRRNTLKLIRESYGRIQIGEERVSGQISDVVVGRVKGREREEERILFTPTGLGIVDIAVAKLAYDRAKEKGLGQRLRL